MNLNLLLLPKKEFQQQLEQNLERITQALKLVEPVVIAYEDASAGAISRYLPDGNSVMVKQYFYVKTDSSGNAVTIYPYDTQLINAGASTALAAQGDKVLLAFDKISQSWWIIA